MGGADSQAHTAMPPVPALRLQVASERVEVFRYPLATTIGTVRLAPSIVTFLTVG